MPRNELRTSGVLQSAVIALLLGALLDEVRDPSAVQAWPYWLGGYALLAATLPWLAGGIERTETGLRAVAILGVAGALPWALAACWLAPTPYRALCIGAWTLVAAWGLLAVVALGRRLLANDAA